MQDFGKMIRERRLALGLTLEQVGDFCGVGKSTVRKWENGIIQNMRRDKIAMLAAILQMDPVDLIGDDVQTSNTPAGISDDALRFALWGGDAEQITQEQLDEVKRFAQFVRERDKK